MTASMNQRRARMIYTEDREIFKEERPYRILSTFDESKCHGPNTNLRFGEEDTEIITDIRGRETSFTLDQHAFEYVKSSTSFKDWEDRRLVEQNHLPEMEKFLLETIDGAQEVSIFDWRLRTSDSWSHVPDMNNPISPLSAATQVHLDQSPMGVLKRVRLLMGDRAESLLRGRVQCINVWRPLEPVEDWPLAVCDGSTVTYDDLIEVDLIRKDYIGSTMFAKYRPGYRWYYLENQRPDEVCLFKNFDSREESPGKICPHASFQQDNVVSDVRPRRSIEIRAFVFGGPKQLSEAQPSGSQGLMEG